MSGEGQQSGRRADEDELQGQFHTVQALYDRWARFYDWNPAHAIVRPARKRAVDAMGLATGDTAIDMGTGTGANLPLLREAVGDTGRVVGLDASPGMLEKAKTGIDDHGWDNVSVVEGDIRDPPIGGPVDGICSAFVAVMYDDPRSLLEPWVELVDGGTVANLYSGPSRRGYSPVPNTLLRGYLRMFDDGWEVSGDRQPIEVLSRRGELARSAMNALADSSYHDDFACGLVKLDVGEF